MENSKKAYEKLKNMALFSEEHKAFEAMFFELMHEGKEREALEYVLQVTFMLLKSDGEVFNEIISIVDDTKKVELSAWVQETRAKYGVN